MKRKSIQLCMSALVVTIIFAVPASAQPNVRPEVQAPLHDAVILAFQEKNINAAMAEISEAEAVPNKTPDESGMISVVTGVIDQVIFQMAVPQRVTVSPAEVDARIAELRAENALPALSTRALRNHITAQIALKKMDY